MALISAGDNLSAIQLIGLLPGNQNRGILTCARAGIHPRGNGMKLSRKKAKVVTSAIEAWIEDNIHKAIFFASLAVSFWLLGSRAEKIWHPGRSPEQAISAD